MKKQALFVFVLAGVLFFACAGSVFAQGGIGNAQLNGTVTDPSGGAVAGASITLTNTATNTTYTATSNDRGYYALANLPPGNYELKASFTGFANYTQTGIVLTVGQVATINIGMQVASAGEKVVVTAEAPVIEPTKTEISQVVDTQQIQSLPISNRLFTDFALLTPGVATSRTSLGTTFTEYEATQISFGGMRSFSNSITVDGADFVNTASGIQRATPPQDSVQEFRVVNNSFGAEYGRALGGIVNIVTKGGTNDFHGAIYDYFQNASLNSRSLLQAAPLPKAYRHNQFGGEVGGPIKQDKTFFFINYEGKRHAESPLYPPDLVNNLNIIDEGKALMNLAPEGCALAGGLSACQAAGISNFGFLQKFLKTADNDYGFARLDHQINANNRLAVRYTIEDARDTGELVGQTLDGGGIGVPSGGRDLFIRDQSVVATLDTTISPTLVNTLLGQYARRHYNFPGVTGQPDFSILNDLEVGHNFGTNDRLYESRGEVGDSVSWVKGTHLVKFGVDGNWLTSLENFPGFTPVRMLIPGVSCFANFAEYYNSAAVTGNNFPTSPALNAAAATCPVPQDNGVVFTYSGVPLPTDRNACSGAPACSSTVTLANPLNTATWANAYPPQFFNRYTRIIDHGYWGAFIQDQWRITPKLTFNYGLRWDVETGLGSYVNNYYHEWQPRIGLAYSPDSKTVIRAGFGMFFDRQNMTFFFVPNTQKIIAGYQCGNHLNKAAAGVQAACAAIGAHQEFPNIQSNLGQAGQGYQIFGFPASQGAAFKAGKIIQTGAYDTSFPAIAMAGTCFTTGACGIGEGGMEHNSPPPYAEQASLQLDRQFGGGLAINLGYLFVGAHRLVRGNNINIPCPIGTVPPPGSFTPADPLPEWMPGLVNPDGTLAFYPKHQTQCLNSAPEVGSGALAGLGPWFEGVFGSGLQTLSGGLEDYNNNVSNAIYHGGTITVIERVKYFSLTGNYTYSHTIDNGNFTTFINLPVNQFDFAAERANSNQDARHRFIANFTANGPEDTWVRHFTLSSIITAQSGRPFTMFYGANTFNDVAGGATDRVGGAPFVGKCTSVFNCDTVIPRNTYIGDPLYSWDFHLGRYFQLTERMKLDLSVDAFNFLNRSNVDEITPVYGSPVFCGGAIPRHYRDATSRAIQAGAVACPFGGIGVPGGSIAPTPIFNDFPGAPGAFLFIPNNPNPNFGLPRTMLNPRQFQFAARFSF
jgi:hypothetical protein